MSIAGPGLRTACRLVRGAAGLGLALIAALPLRAEPVAVISEQQARAALAEALTTGQTTTAWHLARGLIAAHPQDFAAHLALSEAEAGLGRPDAAVQAARRASQLARGPEQRFKAALARAQAAEAAGGPGSEIAAQFWTRRAWELAPHDAWRQVAAGEFARLRNAARLQVQLGFSLAPSSNVNNGSRESLIELPGWGGLLWQLAPQNRALAGWWAEANVTGRYRLRDSATSATFLRFAAARREVRLSSGSVRLLEDWRAQQILAGNTPPAMPNYDHGMVELGLQHQWRAGQSLLTAGVGIGHSWYGGRDLGDQLRLDLGAERGLDAATSVFGGLLLERHWRKPGQGQDNDVLALQGGISRQLASGDRFRLAVTGRDSRSDNVDQRHQALGLRLGWEKAEPVAGVRIEASLGAETRRHDASMLAPNGRRDLRLDGSVSLRFDKMDYMGFVPVLNLNASKVNSNVALHRGRDIGITMGFRSQF